MRTIERISLFAFVFLAASVSCVLADSPAPMVVSGGSVAGDVLSYTVAAFGTVITGFTVKLLLALAKKAGVEVTDQMRARLGEIILNGLNLGAKEAAEKLAGKGPIEVRNMAVASAITYTQVHGADTIHALGLDPTSGEAIEAIRARAETMIADPNTPSHPLQFPGRPCRSGNSSRAKVG